MSRQLFDHVAADYDRYRAEYPSQLFDALESALGQPLLRADVLDVGAGTGIVTRALAGRGAMVVAVDPGPGVLAVLAGRSTSRVRTVVGDGNALPLRDGAFDLVTYGQSWHWTDPARSLPEAARVLHDRGVLAVFWNLQMGDGLDWWERFADSAQRLSPAFDRSQRDFDWGAQLEASPDFQWVRRVEIPWTRELTVDDYVNEQRTNSHVAALAEDAREGLLDELRAGLLAAHPDERVRLPYVTRIWVARR